MNHDVWRVSMKMPVSSYLLQHLFHLTSPLLERESSSSFRPGKRVIPTTTATDDVFPQLTTRRSMDDTFLEGYVATKELGDYVPLMNEIFKGDDKVEADSSDAQREVRSIFLAVLIFIFKIQR